MNGDMNGRIVMFAIAQQTGMNWRAQLRGQMLLRSAFIWACPQYGIAPGGCRGIAE